MVAFRGLLEEEEGGRGFNFKDRWVVAAAAEGVQVEYVSFGGGGAESDRGWGEREGG